MKLLTLNLAYNVMANVAEGSERPQVLKCQQAYNGGWVDGKKDLSRCAQNAARLISEYSIVCLQEIHPAYEERFHQEVQKYNPYFEFKSVGYLGKLNLNIGYNTEVTGKGYLVHSGKIPVELGHASHQRGVMAVYFPKLLLLGITLHAPHGIYLKEEVQKVLSEIEDKVKQFEVQRVLLTGDFNDPRGRLLDVSFKIFDKTLRLPSSEPLKTCCTDIGYAIPGDYIFDTQEGGYYGYPENYVREMPLISDHDPVVREL